MYAKLKIGRLKKSGSLKNKLPENFSQLVSLINVFYEKFYAQSWFQ